MRIALFYQSKPGDPPGNTRVAVVTIRGPEAFALDVERLTALKDEKYVGWAPVEQDKAWSAYEKRPGVPTFLECIE